MSEAPVSRIKALQLMGYLPVVGLEHAGVLAAKHKEEEKKSTPFDAEQNAQLEALHPMTRGKIIQMMEMAIKDEYKELKRRETLNPPENPPTLKPI